jgi:hypothetical protein
MSLDYRHALFEGSQLGPLSLTRDILTNSAEFFLKTVEALVDLVEALVDLVEALVDAIEAGTELCPRHSNYIGKHLDSSFRARSELFGFPLRESIQNALDDDIDLAVQPFEDDGELMGAVLRFRRAGFVPDGFLREGSPRDGILGDAFFRRPAARRHEDLRSNRAAAGQGTAPFGRAKGCVG